MAIATFSERLFFCSNPHPSDRRRGNILGAILAVIATASFASGIIFIARGGPILDWGPDVATAVLVGGIFYDNRRGHVRRSCYITLALQIAYITFFNTFLATEPVGHLIGGFMWIVPIFFAAALMNWRATGLASIYCLANAWICFQQLLSKKFAPAYDVPWELRTLTIMFILVVAAMFCVILRYQTDRYETEVSTRTAELNHLNNQLESEVERRTREAIVARDAANNANRTKGEFLVNMSHELRTPLHSVLGNTDLLLDTGLVEHQKELVHNTRSSGSSLLAMLDDILTYSNLELGAYEVTEQAIDLREWQAKVLAPIMASAQAKHLTMTMTIDSEVPRCVRVDGNHLRRILVNLASNAVKFTSKGEIAISVRVREVIQDRVRLEWQVCDTGIGIVKDKLDRLFEVFDQGDGSLKRRAGGIGLGLVLSKRLIECMGGTIRVQSEPHHGTTFTFDVSVGVVQDNQQAALAEPRVSVKMPPTSDSVRPGSPNRSGSCRILVAEDNIVSQKLAVMMLRKLGYEPVVVSNGIEAVQAFRDNHFDIVLMDVQMPEMDGLEATRRILSETDGKRAPVIIGFTAHILPQDQAQCYAAGMVDIVTKPTELHVLQAALEQAMGTIRAST